MSDALKKVRAGDKIEFSARMTNHFIDAAQDFLNRQQNVTRKNATPPQRTPGIIDIKNESGQDRPRFGILGLGEIMFAPEENETGFLNNFAMRGILPTEADHLGKFAILQVPLKENAIGKAMVFGLTPVKLNVTGDNKNFQYAEIREFESPDYAYTKLDLVPIGSAKVRWKEPGTGEKWGLVQVGITPSPVRVKAVADPADGKVTIQLADAEGNLIDGEYEVFNGEE